MERKTIGFYNYTVILTYCGMLSSVLGLLLAIGQRYEQALLCLILSGGCDMFDGAIASTKERSVREKRFGIQIDSLSDLVSFGVFPGIFAYEYTQRAVGTGIVAGIYILSALIRLAWFNVLEEERQDKTPESEKFFMGVPVTTIVLIFPAVYFLSRIWNGHIQGLFIMTLIVVAAGFLMPIRIKKPNIYLQIFMLLLGAVQAVGLEVLLER